ncbi:MAG: hypothetical protein ACC608_09440 [Anaerofustis sp.]
MTSSTFIDVCMVVPFMVYLSAKAYCCYTNDKAADAAEESQSKRRYDD